jgi:UDP-glucose 4-epimerase
MKILVTGSAGFLGSHLADALIAEGHDVVGVDNLLGGSMENVSSKFYEADTSDFKKMDEIIGKEKPDVVYHCACSPYEGLSVFSPSIITHNTFSNTVAILSASIAHGVKRFVFTSSMSRYGAQQTPFTEDMAPKPEDPYAVAKAASEEVIKQMSETHGIEYAIAVPHNIIGIRQKYDDPFRNVVSIFINRNLQGKPAIIYGDGEQKRSFSFVDDCIYSMLRMIDCPSGEIYNIGPDEKDGALTTINELAELVAEATGFEGKPIFRPDRPREVKVAHCSSEKIRRDFGYTTKTSLRDGISQMVEDIKRQGAKPFSYYLPVEIVNELTPTTWTKKEM